jgi:hypothetical protein
VEFPEPPVGVEEDVPILVTFPTKETAARKDETAQLGDTKRREAAERFLARLKKGIAFGGAPYPKREELYDRFDRADESPG